MPTAVQSQPHPGKCPTNFLHRKNSSPSKNFRNSRNHTYLFPSQGAFLPSDVEAQYAWSILKPVWIFAIQAKLCQFPSDVQHWAGIFIDANVIKECRHCLFDHLLLGQHSTNDGLHDLQHDIQTETQSGQTIPFAMKHDHLQWP